MQNQENQDTSRSSLEVEPVQQLAAAMTLPDPMVPDEAPPTIPVSTVDRTQSWMHCCRRGTPWGGGGEGYINPAMIVAANCWHRTVYA
jgi:hypothetical protein